MRRTAVLLPLLAAALAAVVYANALHNPFVHDDRTEVLENQSIRHITHLPLIVRASPTRPLVNVSYAVDYAIWGLNPFGYHLTNLLLHILNVLLLFALVHHLVRDGWGQHTSATSAATPTAFTAAILFAVHPMMTEAVGYVSGRSELLSGALFLSSLLCFRRAFVIGGRRWLAGAIVLFVAGLLYPASQSVVQPVYPIESIYDSRVVISVGVLAVLAVLTADLRKHAPVVTFPPCIWFFVLLVPSASLILLVARGEAMAEHRVYLASAGFFMAAAALFARFSEQRHGRAWGRLAAIAVGLVAAVSVLAALAVARNRVWESPVRLWEDAARKAPRTWAAVYGMAEAYRMIGDSRGTGVPRQRRGSAAVS